MTTLKVLPPDLTRDETAKQRFLEEAKAHGAGTDVPFDANLPVDTDWDLGIADKMTIWFSQSRSTGEVRLIATSMPSFEVDLVESSRDGDGAV